MTIIKMLGTGGGGTTDLYNTCFVIKNEQGLFLVDTGGGIEILKRLKKSGIELTDIHDIFISHSHIDHIMGLFWMFKMFKGNNKVSIYCNDVVCEAIKNISGYILPDRLKNSITSVANFILLQDGDKHTINGVEYRFFDIRAKGVKQYGFETVLDGNKFIFLGDETLNPELNDKIRSADYVMHEALCLDAEENIFHAYAKHHSTALSVAKNMNDLKVRNLILYHTEESHGADRPQLYKQEAQTMFQGNVIVPDDLEEIPIPMKL